MTKSAPTALALSPAERSELRARAHHLEPVVMVGDAGLTPAVIAEAERALKAHELIKVRVFGDDRDVRLEYLRVLCDSLGCQPVQHIGKLLVVYRRRPAVEARDHVPKKRLGVGAKAQTKKGAKKPARKPGRKTPIAPPARSAPGRGLASRAARPGAAGAPSRARRPRGGSDR